MAQLFAYILILKMDFAVENNVSASARKQFYNQVNTVT